MRADSNRLSRGNQWIHALAKRTTSEIGETGVGPGLSRVQTTPNESLPSVTA